MSNLDKLRNKLKDEEANRSSIFAVEKSLKADQPNVIRIIDPEDVVEYFEAWMVCDDGEKRPFIVENSHQGEGTLARILGNRHEFYRGGILDSRIDEFKQKYYYYENVDPELLLQVAHNNDKSGESGSWKPSRRYLFHCIDREPETEGNLVGQFWCVLNKHTKNLKVGAQGLTGLVDVRDNDGNLEDFDINYKKMGSGRKGTTHTVMKAGDRLPYVVVGPISDEERAYERYNLKIETAISTATEILKYLRTTIERIDRVMGTTYLKELEAQAESEMAEREANGETVESASIAQPQPASSRMTTLTNQSVQQPVQQVAPPIRNASVQPVPVQPAPVQPAPVQQPVQPAPVQQPAQKSDIIQCPLCNNQTQLSEKCSACNQIIMEPCQKCKTPFLITENTCPNCGQVYQLAN